MKTIYEQIKATGCKIDHHESDLYCEVTPETTAIVNNYKFKCNVTRFISKIEHTPWFDIPYAYEPEWDRRDSRK